MLLVNTKEATGCKVNIYLGKKLNSNWAGKEIIITVHT